MTVHPSRPDPAAVARALAVIVAESNTGTLHFTRNRMTRELAARTGYPFRPEEVPAAVHAASPVAARTFGVYVEHVERTDGGGWRWRLSVQPSEAA
ncbi:hypothetical protein [Micromonospora tulbaghiae]